MIHEPILFERCDALKLQRFSSSFVAEPRIFFFLLSIIKIDDEIGSPKNVPNLVRCAKRFWAICAN